MFTYDQLDASALAYNSAEHALNEVHAHTSGLYPDNSREGNLEEAIIYAEIAAEQSAKLLAELKALRTAPRAAWH